MSDHFIRIIPVDPRFVPTKRAQKAAIAVIRAAAPMTDEVSSETDDQIVFRDCGENFERVRCPGCGNEIALDTWQEWMSADYSDDDGFRLEALAIPCCNHRATLNELRYEMAQGFSRYVLSAMNIGQELPSSVLAKLEGALGCQLRIIRQMI